VTQFYGRAKAVAMDVRRRSNLSDTYRFVDRRRNAATAVFVLAGYKPQLWPFVFPRLECAMPEEADVCIMTAGKQDDQLQALAEQNGWSYLATRTNDICLVQNIALNLHPAAERIVKVDEDMFVTRGTIRDCLDYYSTVKASGIVNPAFVAPTINVNGVCHRSLLERLDLLEEFETEFGVARVCTLGTALTDRADAAKWMWQKTAPLETTLDRIRDDGAPMLMAPVQFSIGLIVIERSFLEDINLLPVRWHMLMMKESTLGADEEYLCRMAVFFARPIVVCPHALAGHFSFGRQYAGMLQFLAEHPEVFEYHKDGTT
jgi:hypothetical protein